MMSYDIRWATCEDWQPTMDMVWKTFMKFEAGDYTREGIDNFYDFIFNGMIYHLFLEGRYPMFVALDGEKIIGQISSRNGNRISLLFVDEAYHRQGIGTELIHRMSKYLKEEKNQRSVSVMAAPYAVDFYGRLGFNALSGEEAFSGIRVTPMEKAL